MVDNRGSSKRKRWILIASAVVVAVLLATLVLPVLIKSRKGKSQTVQVVGRSVKLGSLSLSILLGKLVASDVEVADNPAFI